MLIYCLCCGVYTCTTRFLVSRGGFVRDVLDCEISVFRYEVVLAFLTLSCVPATVGIRKE